MLRQVKLLEDGPAETVTPAFSCGNCGHTWPQPAPAPAETKPEPPAAKDVDPDAHGPRGIDYVPPKEEPEPAEDVPMPTASAPPPAEKTVAKAAGKAVGRGKAARKRPSAR